MKRNYALVLVLVTIFAGCKIGNKKEEVKNVTDEPVMGKTTAGSLIGSYVGAFGDNKITMLIIKAVNDSVEGRTVVGGNDRPFAGTMHQSEGGIAVLAKEPGGDAHDGTFNFTISNESPDIIKGSWKPYNEAGNMKGKEYILNRRSFNYVKEVGIYPQASARLLKDEDLNNLTTTELETMRNEIFARHGYCFKKKNLRAAFEDKDWYIPNTADVKGLLTETEKKNIALIKNFEKYAESFGDDFGR